MPWSLTIHHIDLGSNGDSTVVVATDGNTTKTVLIDGGRNSSTDVVNTYIAGLTVPTVDVIVVTHYDDDHFGGIVGLLSLTNVAGRYDHATIFDQGKPPDTDKFTSRKTNANGELKQLYPRYLAKLAGLPNVHRLTADVNSFQITSFDNNWNPIIPVQANQQAFGGHNYWPANWLVGKEIMWGNNQVGNGYLSNPPDLNAPTIHCIAANKYVQQPGGMNFVSEKNRFLGISANQTARDENANDNTKSLAFLIRFGNFRYYIGGDIESSQEDGSVNRKSSQNPQPFYEGILNYLNQNDSMQNRVQVMKASHHGSAKSTSRLFLNTLRPGTALISNSGSGGSNRFEHPAARVANVLDGYESQPILYADTINQNNQPQHPPQPPLAPQKAIPSYLMLLSPYLFNAGVVTSLAANPPAVPATVPGHTRIQVSQAQSGYSVMGDTYRAVDALVTTLAPLLNINGLQAATIADAGAVYGISAALAAAFGLNTTIQIDSDPVSQTSAVSNETWFDIASAIAWAGPDHGGVGVIETAIAQAQLGNNAAAIAQAISLIDNGDRIREIGYGSAEAIGEAFTNAGAAQIEQAAINGAHGGATQQTAQAAAQAAVAMRNGAATIANSIALPNVGYAIAAAFGARKTNTTVAQAAMMAVAQSISTVPLQANGLLGPLAASIQSDPLMDWLFNVATANGMNAPDAALAAGIAAMIYMNGNIFSIRTIARKTLTLAAYAGNVGVAEQAVVDAAPYVAGFYNVVYRTTNQAKSY